MPRRQSFPIAVAAAGLAAAVLTVTAGARATVIPVSEVRPGMVGVGRTVFRGEAVEEFTVRVIGTLKSVVAPQRDLVLARLEGGPLAETGVIAGMSGSPVYIDGRLLGAVSYQLGQFPKEPIAGITPIAEMTDATALAGTRRAAGPVRLALDRAATPDELVGLWRRELGTVQPFAAAAADLLALSDRAGLPRQVVTDLRPISVPLVSSGFAPGVLDRLAPSLQSAGFLPVQAPPRTAAATTTPATLAPGDAVGVALLSGDFSLGATGTVTEVDGDRVYAFGHPLYNLGPTAFPMTRAEVLTVLPSMVTSSKLASLGAVVGTVSQDRATAIAGRLGPAPPLIPVSVTLNSRRGPTRRFSFGVADDQLFTPLLTYLAVANVITSYERQTGAATYVVRGRAEVADAGAVAFDDVFVGDQGAANAAAYVAGPITALYRNATSKFALEGITLTIDAEETTRTAVIERAWVDDPVVAPGREVELHVVVRTSTGEEQLLHQTVTVPSHATGTMQLVVSDGPRLGLQDQRDSRRAELQPVAQIVRASNRARRSNRLYVRLTAPAAGAVIDGEPLPGLPASVAGVIDGDRPSSGGATLRVAPRGEWEIPLEYAVSGSRQLSLTIEP
ncbi:MAG: SpoIVB peptidase S55 domain-containing protein [Vicinamibacterales bacterium]